MIRAEEMVKTKDQERKDLLMTYKNLLSQHAELETALENQHRELEKSR
jgi:hypothetical protein